MKLLVFALTMLLAAPLWAGADDDFDAIAKARRNKDHAGVAKLAEQFADAHAGDKRTPGVLQDAGADAHAAGDYDASERLLRRVMEKYPDTEQAWAARKRLLQVLRDGRKLEALLRELDRRLDKPGELDLIEELLFFRAECLFRLWRFQEANVALSTVLGSYPETIYGAEIREMLARIDPKIAIDANGLADDYHGKFERDARFKRAIKSLPDSLKQARLALKETLGLVGPEHCRVVLRFADAPAYPMFNGERATTATIALKGKAWMQITFYADFVVLDAADFKQRLTHEFKHALCRDLMGQAYFALPNWVQEGLALYGAGQTEDRLAYFLGDSATTVSRMADPLAYFGDLGEANHRFDAYDYPKAALAIEWLESLKPGNVRAFVKRLIAGEGHRSALAAVSGLEFEQALAKADNYVRARIRDALGDGYKRFEDLTRSQDALKDKARDAWFEKTGRKAFEDFLEKYPDHCMAPTVRYRLGQGLEAKGDLREARRWYRHVRDEDDRRSSLSDDAAYAFARASESADEELGCFLRDYGWSPRASDLHRQGVKPAGPVTEDDEKK